jgi:Uma2 family endonuclease
MVTNLIQGLDLDADELYPDSDGKPMADNTEQYEWIVKIKENLEILFAKNPDIFIAGDLLWYPVKSTLVTPCAPDVMVVFGRPKGRRGSYKQWVEDNIAPQVVFEILSPKNTKSEMSRKLEFYQTYGVEEYYLYDPHKSILRGWTRQENVLQEITFSGTWASRLLGIRFQQRDSGLEIYYPNGDKFLSSIELAEQLQKFELQVQEAQLQAEQEKHRAERLAQRLRELGFNPDDF